VNSLKAARDGGFSGGIDDPNDAYRYEKLKIYSRVTGKSMYKEYDAMLEAYEELMQEQIESKLVE
jgi:thiamine biosynthesis protein ThiC